MNKLNSIIQSAVITCLMASSASAATYNGPTDSKQYAQPKDVMCYGIPNYPKGANLTFAGSYIGNLQDGFSYAHMEGQVGIMYFQYMTQTEKNMLKGNVTTIDTLNDFAITNKVIPVKCKVKSWY